MKKEEFIQQTEKKKGRMLRSAFFILSLLIFQTVLIHWRAAAVCAMNWQKTLLILHLVLLVL